MIENLLHFYYQATDEQLEQAEWYTVANQACRQVADDFGLPLENVVYAVAALSPGCYWERNIQGVVDLYTKGTTVHGYGANRIKALACLDGDIAACKGPKVTAFAKNILDPEKYGDTVTVDTWAIRAYHGVVSGKVNTPTPKQHAAISDAYIAGAEIVGLMPAQFQAVVWVVAREQGKQYLSERKRKVKK